MHLNGSEADRITYLAPKLLPTPSDLTCYMIPDGCNTPDEDLPHETLLANASAVSPTATKTALPDTKSGPSSVFSGSYTPAPASDVPPRPSTAPPHPSSDATKGKEPQADLQTRTTLVSHLRARNLLLQKAISHIDDAVLHLMAARSGIPSSKIQQVRGEARNRKDLLDRVDRAIRLAQSDELQEESQHVDMTEDARSRPGDERPTTGSGPTDTLDVGAPSGIMPPIPPSVIRPPPSDASLVTPQLRRSSSQPQLGPPMGQPQVPTKVYTLLELIERRRVLQESIESWQKFATELRAAQPHLEVQARSITPSFPEVVSTKAPAAPPTQAQDSWTVKHQRAQFEIKRREDLLARLNQAIAQVSHPTPEQIATLATFVPPALDKPRFDAAYAHFCRGKSIEMNTTIIMPDVSKPVIDVYSLHVAVMQEGSFTRVSARKSWDIVGGRLGFIRTAATASEPARSSPEIAVHLEKAYRDRLQQFDHVYVSSVVETVRKRMAEQQKKP